MICNPASEERSPPAKYILICLLLSKVKVFTLLIRAPLGYFLRFDTLILPQMEKSGKQFRPDNCNPL